MEKTELKVGDVVQLHPDKVGNKAFAGCFMTVTEPKEWGAQGYVRTLGTREEIDERIAIFEEVDGCISQVFDELPVDVL